MLSHNFGKKVLCLTCLNNVFLVTDDFCIKWVFWKNLIFCLKKAFFSQKLKYIPLFHLLPLWCQGTFFPLIFFFLNSEGFVGGRWRRWWNPPMNIFNSAKNGPFLEDKKKKVAKSYWNPIHRLSITQIHHDTMFLTQYFVKMPQFLFKKVISIIFKNLHFWLFSGVPEVK